jgi:hypothetical protein
MAESYLCSRLIPDQQKREQTVLRIGMFLIFLLLALKKETVGVDIMGYMQEYEASAAVAWSNTSYVYFEWGYIQLMKLFSKMGLSFQVFTILIYAFSMYAYYRFIQRYSQNTTMSLLIFVCYQFLVFYISGLRQALAMAICICAFLLLDSQRGKKWQRVLGAFLVVWVAASIHQSAWLFLFVILITLVKPEQVHWAALSLVLIASVFMRPLVLRLINMLIGRVNLESGITLGGNFLFLLGLMLLCTLGNYQHGQSQEEDRFLPIATNAMIMAVIAQVLFSGSSLLRSSMYMTLFMIPGLPCALKRFERRLEITLTYFLSLFLIVLFLTDTLIPNQLGLCPYLFFWQ